MKIYAKDDQIVAFPLFNHDKLWMILNMNDDPGIQKPGQFNK